MIQIIQWQNEKGQNDNNGLQITTRKRKIGWHEPHRMPGWTWVLRKG